MSSPSRKNLQQRKRRRMKLERPAKIARQLEQIARIRKRLGYDE
jgi:hypothetical protein